MRILCDRLVEFVENLVGNEVLLKTVYVAKTVDHLNGKSMRDATSFSVGIRVSAVVVFGEDGEALLEAAEDCGMDRLTSDGDLGGTAEYEKKRAEIVQLCKSFGLQVRPGTLDM